MSNQAALHELIERLVVVPLNKREGQVIMAIAAGTILNDEPDARLPAQAISERTGVPRRKVAEQLPHLENLGLIRREGAKQGDPGRIALNLLALNRPEPSRDKVVSTPEEGQDEVTGEDAPERLPRRAHRLQNARAEDAEAMLRAVGQRHLRLWTFGDFEAEMEPYELSELEAVQLRRLFRELRCEPADEPSPAA